VCVGWREVGSVCSNINIAAVRSATATGSSYGILLEVGPVCFSILREVGPVCSNISIAAAPLSATAA
jgi:hypothetical protein